MVIGVLQVEMRLPNAHSLKDKRSVVKSLKDQLRGRFNVAVAELAADEKWQRATIGVSTLGDERAYVEGVFREVTEWIRMTRLVELIRLEAEYL